MNGKNGKFKGLEVKPLCMEIEVLCGIYNIFVSDGQTELLESSCNGFFCVTINWVST